MKVNIKYEEGNMAKTEEILMKIMYLLSQKINQN